MDHIIDILHVENYIDGQEFISLTESDVKSMISALGICRKIVRLLPSQEVTGEA